MVFNEVSRSESKTFITGLSFLFKYVDNIYINSGYYECFWILPQHSMLF